jgi:hypothetical protein
VADSVRVADSTRTADSARVANATRAADSVRGARLARRAGDSVPATVRHEAAARAAAPTTPSGPGASAPTTPAANNATPPKTAPPAQPAVDAALAKIRESMRAAGRAIALGQPLRSENELRSARGAMKALRESFPAGQVPAPVLRQLREIPPEAQRACMAAAQTDLGAQQRCRDFQQREARGRGGRSGR